LRKCFACGFFKCRAFALRASYFCFGKSNQNHQRLTLAEDGEAVLGALRFSPERVRRPNSLRSNMGAFSPFPAAMLGEL
jgi:hypothetical protein